MDNLFHHKGKGSNEAQGAHATETPQPQKGSELQKLEKDFKKDEQSFKEYIKKDEEMQREGNGAEYGGLM